MAEALSCCSRSVANGQAQIELNTTLMQFTFMIWRVRTWDKGLIVSNSFYTGRPYPNQQLRQINPPDSDMF